MALKTLDPGLRRGDKRFALVIFDLDGTLVDTAPEIGDALNAYLRERGITEASAAEVRGWIGHGAGELLRQALASRGVNGAPPAAEELRRFGEIYFAHCGRNSRVFPHGLTLLDALRVRGVRLALMTNKESRFVQPVLDAHALRGRFDVVVCGDTLPARKPDPLPVRHCMATAGAGVDETLVIGDSEIDVETAHAAGVQVWAVDWGYGRPERAHRMISGFEGLAAAILDG